MSDTPTAPENLPDGAVIHTTERLRLRLFRRDDLPVLAELHGSPVVMEFLGGVMTAEQSNQETLEIQEFYRRNGFGKLAIERISDGALLGTCGLSREHWYPADLEIGWRLAPQYWGFGYATEAARFWLQLAFNTLGASRVISITDTPNHRSRAVMHRLGLALDHEAELQDVDGSTFEAVIYAISAQQWAPQDPPDMPASTGSA